MDQILSGQLAGPEAATWLRFGLDLALKGTVLLMAAHALTWIARHARPELRSRIWTVTFCCLLILPAMGLVTPRLVAPLVEVTPLSVQTMTAEPTSEISRVTQPFGHQNSPAGIEAELESTRAVGPAWPWWQALTMIWMGGVVALLIRSASRLAGGMWLALRASPAPPEFVAALGLGADRGRAPDLHLSHRIVIPFVAGVMRPRLVLPADAVHWPAEALRPVVQHELAHVRRNDYLRLVLAELVCAVFWYQPLAWHAARRAALTLEMACDEAAWRSSGDRRGYAHLLLSMAERIALAREPAPTPGLARAADIEVRLRHLLGHPATLTVRRYRFVTAGLLALLAVAVIPASAVRLSQPEVIVSGTAVGPQPQTPVAESSEPAPVSGDIHVMALRGDHAGITALLDTMPSQLEHRDFKGMTPLAQASWGGHAALVADLLARGADPDVRNANGLTPLFSALDRGKRSVARALLDGGADIQVRGYHGWTMLHAAARIGDTELVHRFLAAGLDPDARSTDGDTPLHFARWGHHDSTIAALIAAGAEAELRPRPGPTGKNLLTVR